MNYDVHVKNCTCNPQSSFYIDKESLKKCRHCHKKFGTRYTRKNHENICQENILGSSYETDEELRLRTCEFCNDKLGNMYTCKRHKIICKKNPKNQKAKIANGSDISNIPHTLLMDDVHIHTHTHTPKTVMDVSQITKPSNKSKKRKLSETTPKISKTKIIKISIGRTAAI